MTDIPTPGKAGGGINQETSKFGACEKVTAVVRTLTADADRLLREGFDGRIMVNMLGVFSDPAKRRGELQAAREAIDKALALLNAAPWPTKEDYDRL
jgi:hypothetical protein